MTPPPFTLVEPLKRSTSVLFASPHSGREYSRAFLRKSVLNAQAIRSSEDAFLDLIFQDAPCCGAPLLAATAPRAFVDLNRSAEELDPAVIEGVKRSQLNPRVSSGLGVIPRVVSNGRAIYRGKLSLEEARARLSDWWRPYHDQLQTMLDANVNVFGQAILLDLHSMPHEALDSVTVPGRPRPDIVLGDRFGAAAAPEIVEQVEAIFASAGLTVARNAPFAGAYITQRYGRPSRGQNAIQIEIDRSLYMDEVHVRPNARFEAFRDLISGLLPALTDIGRPTVRLAAE